MSYFKSFTKITRPSPLSQGDVSGDCVIYSALNAARWLWPAKFAKIEDCEALYARLLHMISAAEIKATLINGTTSNAAHVIALHLSNILFINYGLRLSIIRLPFCENAGLDGVKAIINDLSANQVAIMGLDEPWDHWTCATPGATSKTILFYDSYAPDRLKRVDWCDFTTKKEAGKIQIDVAATVIYEAG